jgi:hypothetical protein
MPKPLLTGHPPWRQMVIVAVVLPAVIAGAVWLFAWPAARIQPREVAIGLVGSTPGSQQLLDRISTAEPGGFDVRLYPDEDAASSAIRHRQIYGAFFVSPRRVEVFEASAASPAVARLLTSIGAGLAGGGRRAGGDVQLATRDVVPLSAGDPNGLVFSSSLLPLTICSIIVAAAIGVLVRFRPAWRQIVALTVVSAGVGAGAYLISQGLLDALPHEGLADWAGISLTVLAISAATAGLVALIGALGLGVAAVLMVFAGNPFSGAGSAPELLPDAVDRIGQWLPPGAGANLLRSTAYFGGSGATGHVAVLITWAVLGMGAIALGHHAPIRFAARNAASVE